MKKILCILFFSSPLMSMQLAQWEIKKELDKLEVKKEQVLPAIVITKLQVKKEDMLPTIGALKTHKPVPLYHGPDGFYIVQNSKESKIQKRFTINNVEKFYINPNVVFAPNKLGAIDLFKGKKGFYVIHNNVKHRIQKADTDKILRNISHEQLFAFLQHGHLSVNQLSDGSFTLKAKGHLVGGGYIGMCIGVFAGKAIVHAVGHGAIHIVALATGPAYPATFFALEGIFAPAIEAASMHGALYGGITLGTITGLV